MTRFFPRNSTALACLALSDGDRSQVWFNRYADGAWATRYRDGAGWGQAQLHCPQTSAASVVLSDTEGPSFCKAGR